METLINSYQPTPSGNEMGDDKHHHCIQHLENPTTYYVVNPKEKIQIRNPKRSPDFVLCGDWRRWGMAGAEKGGNEHITINAKCYRGGEIHFEGIEDENKQSIGELSIRGGELLKEFNFETALPTDGEPASHWDMWGGIKLLDVKVPEKTNRYKCINYGTDISS